MQIIPIPRFAPSDFPSSPNPQHASVHDDTKRRSAGRDGVRTGLAPATVEPGHRQDSLFNAGAGAAERPATFDLDLELDHGGTAERDHRGHRDAHLRDADGARPAPARAQGVHRAGRGVELQRGRAAGGAGAARARGLHRHHERGSVVRAGGRRQGPAFQGHLGPRQGDKGRHQARRRDVLQIVSVSACADSVRGPMEDAFVPLHAALPERQTGEEAAHNMRWEYEICIRKLKRLEPLRSTITSSRPLASLLSGSLHTGTLFSATRSCP